MDDLLRRLIDYVRMSIESGETKKDSGVGVAYRDYVSHVARQKVEKPDTAQKPKIADIWEN